MTHPTPPALVSGAPAGDGPACAPPCRALLLGLDAGNAGLVRHWLLDAGWQVQVDDAGPGRPDLVVLGSPYPRHELVEPALRGRSGCPVLLVSPTVLPGTPPAGALARDLGVAAVLAVPLDRAGFVALCRQLVGLA